MYVIGLMFINALKKRNTMKEKRDFKMSLDYEQKKLIAVFLLGIFTILLNIYLSITNNPICYNKWFNWLSASFLLLILYYIITAIQES